MEEEEEEEAEEEEKEEEDEAGVVFFVILCGRDVYVGGSFFLELLPWVKARAVAFFSRFVKVAPERRGLVCAPWEKAFSFSSF